MYVIYLYTAHSLMQAAFIFNVTCVCALYHVCVCVCVFVCVCVEYIVFKTLTCFQSIYVSLCVCGVLWLCLCVLHVRV